jgi:hypothetical protein
MASNSVAYVRLRVVLCIKLRYSRKHHTKAPIADCPDCGSPNPDHDIESNPIEMLRDVQRYRQHRLFLPRISYHVPCLAQLAVRHFDDRSCCLETPPHHPHIKLQRRSALYCLWFPERRLL